MYNETNETLNLLYERGSVRAYSDKEVTEEVLEKVLLAGKHAASGGNLQPLSIIVVTDEKKRNKLEKLNMFPIKNVPVLMFFCIDWYRTKRWANLEKMAYTADKSFRHFIISFQDMICHMQSICTAADAVGLGTCIYGTVQEVIPELRDILKLPPSVLPINLVTMGYPKKKPPIANKLDLDMLFHKNEYKEYPDEEFLAKMYKKHNKDLQLKENYLDGIYQVCKNVEGENFAKETVKHLKERGSIPAVSRYFGYRKYNADCFANHNKRIMKDIENAGFKIFADYDFGGKLPGED